MRKILASSVLVILATLNSSYAGDPCKGPRAEYSRVVQDFRKAVSPEDKLKAGNRRLELRKKLNSSSCKVYSTSGR